VEALQGEVSELVQKSGGSVENTDVWGRRKLAYEIGHHNEGIYIVQLLEGPGEMIAELGRRLRVRDQVLRHLTVRVDEDLRKVRRAAEKKKATAQRPRGECVAGQGRSGYR
jgi:small subunit ribosomal protein S6